MAVPVAAQVAAAVAAAEGRDGGRAARGGEVDGVRGGGDGGVAGGGGQLDDGGEEVLQLPRRHTPGGSPADTPTDKRPPKESKRDTLVNLLGVAASLLRHL